MKNKIIAVTALCVAAGLLHLIMWPSALHWCVLPRGSHLLASLACFACAVINARKLKKYEKPTPPPKLEWY